MSSTLKSKRFLSKDYLYRLALEGSVGGSNCIFLSRNTQEIHFVNTIRIAPTVSERAYLFRMASQGRTIVMSIHQPRYSIYRLFDTLTLLVSGKMVYHGPAPNALDYFANIGDMCRNSKGLFLH